MADLSFLPFDEGEALTPEKLNALVESIQDGSIFLPGNTIGDLINTLDSRVTVLESKVASLELLAKSQNQREQFILTDLQTVISLAKVPLIDSEIVALNGMVQSRDNSPAGVSGDYTIVGKVITLTTELALNIVAGDRFTVTYRFEVA